MYIRRSLSIPRFGTLAVIGGRGVGKTRLIAEASNPLLDTHPYIYLNLLNFDKNNSKKDNSTLPIE